MYSNIVHKNIHISNFFLSRKGVVHVFKYCAQKHPAIEFLSEQKLGLGMYSNIVHKNSQLSNFFLSKNGVGRVFKYCAQKHPAIEFLSKQKRGWACIQILRTETYSYRISV